MSATLRLKYLAPHHPHLSAGTVRVQAEDTIFEVIELICKSYPNLSAANTNDLYKCSNFFLEPTDNRHERALAVLAAGKFERLNELHTVGKHFSANADRSEQLDVVIVPRASFRDGIHTLAASEYDRYKKYHETFIKVSKHDKFEEGDVQLNGIQECPPERVPEFVANFKDLLTKQAIISTECQFPGTPDGVYLSEDEDSQHSVSQQEGHYRLAGETEAAHIQWLRSLDWERLWRSPNLKGALENALKEDAFHALYSFGAMLDLPEDTKLTIMRKTQSWPFMLIITSAEHDATSRLEERYRTYRPKSDFSIWSSGLPRLLVEVNSTQPRNGLMPFDQVRLLLAGASVVRFANRGVAEYNQEKKFVLVCVYVEDNGTTVRYLLFQNSKDSAVYYTKDTFLVSKSQDRVIFARDLHNLSYMLGRSPEDNDTKMKDY
ncbi:hypothetical protein BC835DRAFT_282916 [Cytidiella melzeri]|nr:hypothetical protein BC835DRAFT_282916 [Cytidiella melzeri]